MLIFSINLEILSLVCDFPQNNDKKLKNYHPIKSKIL